MVRENYAIWLKHIVYWGESDLGIIENSLMSLRGQKENVLNKENSPPIRDFMNERSSKLNKIFNLHLLKFDCQNLPFRGSLASQELKFNLKTI